MWLFGQRAVAGWVPQKENRQPRTEPCLVDPNRLHAHILLFAGVVIHLMQARKRDNRMTDYDQALRGVQITAHP